MKTIGSAADTLLKVIHLCKDSNCKIYIIIDEYDNFANTILSTSGSKAYEALTHGEGFFRAFFNVLKEGTTGSGAPISRLFITGVSPVTLDDVTSGFNIGKNISLEPGFNRMLGFTQDDVIEMIEYYRSNGLIQHPTDDLLAIMIQWYGNYLFSEDDNVRLYNSDMVLYFIDNYLTRKKLPDDLIDMNVRIDYRKLRHLVIVDRDKTKTPTPNGNFNKLKKIIEEGSTASKIVKGFPVEKLKEAENFKSLLFYLGLSDLYIIHSEKELNKGYADPVKPGVVKVVLEPFLARYEGMKYSYVLEIKYVKSKEGKKIDTGNIQQLKAAAGDQLKNYSIDENFKKNIEKTRLIKLVLIFSGHELIDIDEVK